MSSLEYEGGKIAVTLTPYEMKMGALVGIERCVDSVSHNRQDPTKSKRLPNHWAIEINGSCAELAVAKALGYYWGGDVNTFKAPDLEGIQIRNTDLDEGRLIVRPNDSDNEIFVLVTGYLQNYRIVGWLYGHQCKKDYYHYKGTSERPEPCFMVPQGDLFWFNPDKAPEDYQRIPLVQLIPKIADIAHCYIRERDLERAKRKQEKNSQ